MIIMHTFSYNNGTSVNFQRCDSINTFLLINTDTVLLQWELPFICCRMPLSNIVLLLISHSESVLMCSNVAVTKNNEVKSDWI